ncbi:MAG: hypothetical protein ABGZ37_12210 [Akkermansiaceae bacterium]
MDVEKLMVVALAGWISRQQEDVIDYATTVSGLVDCFATSTGMRRESMNYQRLEFLDTTPSLRSGTAAARQRIAVRRAAPKVPIIGQRERG